MNELGSWLSNAGLNFKNDRVLANFQPIKLATKSKIRRNPAYGGSLMRPSTTFLWESNFGVWKHCFIFLKKSGFFWLFWKTRWDLDFLLGMCKQNYISNTQKKCWFWAISRFVKSFFKRFCLKRQKNIFFIFWILPLRIEWFIGFLNKFEKMVRTHSGNELLKVFFYEKNMISSQIHCKTNM